MDRFNRFRSENRFTAGSGDPETFSDIVMGLLFRQRGGLAAQHDALAELSQLWQLQLLFQLLLSRQYDLQQLLSGCLEVGQQANFFEHRVGQVLCFVHDEHGGFTRTVTIEKPLVEPHQLLTLVPRLAGNSELREYEIEQLIRIHPGIKEKRSSYAPLLQPGQKAVYERSFSRADFTGERDEAFPILNAIHQPAQRFLDLFSKKEIARIWIDVERIFFQPEIAFVHWSLDSRRRFSGCAARNIDSLTHKPDPARRSHFLQSRIIAAQKVSRARRIRA